MRIHIASHLFVPRPQGVFCAELARHWAGRGHEIVVFTGDPAPASPYADEAGERYEVVGGLPMAYGRSSLGHRLASRVAFGASAAAASARRHSPDVFLSAGVLPLLTETALSMLGRAVGRGRPRRIGWVFDLWPDVLVAHRPGSTAVQMATAPLAGGTNLVLRLADDLVAISPHMAAVISARVAGGRGAPPVHTIPLWASAGPDRAAHAGDLVPAAAPDTVDARRPLRAMYHGNLGLSYDFEPILAGAARFAPDEVTFVLVGDGAMRQSLARRIERDRLTNVELRPPLPEREFTRSLGTADVHLLPLRESWDGISFPSKLLPYLSVARPIVVLGPSTGESARLVRDAGCGLTEAASAAGLESALRTLAGNPTLRATMARAGRALYLRQFAAARAFAAWDALIADSTSGSGP